MMKNFGQIRNGKHRNWLAKTAWNRAAEQHRQLVHDAVPGKRRRLVSEPIIPQCSPQGQQIATVIPNTSAAPDRETRKLPNMNNFSAPMLTLAARSKGETEATTSDALHVASSTAQMAVTANIVPKEACRVLRRSGNFSRAGSGKVVADVMSATASTDVSSTAHAKAMTKCAAEGIMPSCVTMIVPNSDM
jgi:hypothetical protein